jgi:hypothetical protein
MILKIETITWLQDNPASAGGDFLAGDIVEIFFDTSTLIYSVKKNGVSYTGTAQISAPDFDWLEQYGFVGPSFRTRTLVTTNFCVGTTLYQFQQGTGFFHYDSDYPYSSAITIENANQCALVPITPDITFLGNPIITNASTSSSNDGSVVAEADSSYGPVQYVLNPYQALWLYPQYIPNFTNERINFSGVFTGLAAGQYSLIIVDSKNFYTVFNFNIEDISASHPLPPVVVCDIMFPGTPTINQDTGSGNGSITFGATSSASIEYSLSGNVLFGAGQASSTFSNLVAGQYILYAFDANYCKAQYAFTIPLNSAPSIPPASTPTYNIVYQASWRDLNGVQAFVYIKKKGYTGAITEVVCAGEPMTYSLRLEGNDDKYTPIGASELVLNLMSTTPEQFEVLFTTDSNTYQIHYLKSNQLKLVGKVYPATLSWPYHQNGGTAYPVSIKATDGLVELDDVPFVDDGGTRFHGTAKQIVVIAKALNKLKFGINIRVACNLYADGMNTADSDDPLDQCYVDYLSYYKDFEPLSCLEVIKRNIEPYQATIVQWNGYWWIIRREELVGTVAFREYNKFGSYVSNSSYDPVVTLRSGLRWANKDASIDMILPKGYIEVDYSQGKRQLVPNSDFAPIQILGNTSIDLTGYSVINAGDPYLQTGLTSIDDEDENVGVRIIGTGVSYLKTGTKKTLILQGSDQLKIGLRYKVETQSASFRYQKVKIQVQFGTYYLTGEGKWDPFTRVVGNGNAIIIYETDFGKFKDWEIKAPRLLLSVTQLSGGSGTASLVIDGVGYALAYSTSLTVTAKSFVNVNASAIYSAHGLIVSESAGSLVLTDLGNSHLPAVSVVNLTGTLSGVTTSADSAAGYFLSVNYYSSWILDAEFTSYATLKTKITRDLPPASKSEIKLSGSMLYYELENNVSAEANPSIVRPSDYDATYNPYQWILKQSTPYLDTFSRPGSNSGSIVIDKVIQDYLPGGNEIEDMFIINKAPKNSNQVFKKELFHGSLRNTNYTLLQWGLDLGTGQASFSGTSVGNPNGALTFINYLRNSLGAGWVNWTRDAVSEAIPLEQICANAYIAQYKTASKRITGSLTNNKQTPVEYLSPISVLKDGDDFYLPMGLSIMDKNNIFSGEFAELIDITQGGTVTDGGIKTGNTSTNASVG